MRDIFATSNRGFIEGFLHGNPQAAGQEYLTSNPGYSSYRFIAVVKGYDQERQRLNLEMRNPMKLWHRTCMCDKNHLNHTGKCTNEFETSYSPDRPEIIYCEQCYQQEVN